MISFYPGPSRVYDSIPKYVKQAHRDGILSINHRSEEFIALCKDTVALLKEKLNVPQNYTVYFTSSATECWEIIAQSLIKKQSVHIYNGAFGEKWYDYTKRLIPEAISFPFDREEELNPAKLIFKKAEVICLTQNETSNGTQVSNDIIDKIKKNNPKQLIAIDVTSSIAGVTLNFEAADIWFASVQKCFGLPAGLGIMICSPKTIEKMDLLQEKNHYNSLLFMNEMMKKWQTPYTPNVLGIYLLMRILQKRPNISKTHKIIKKRFEKWNNFFKSYQNLTLLIKNNAVQSYTVLTLKGNPEFIENLKEKAKKNGFLLGNGYGLLKNETLRIANFPALRKKEIRQLMEFFLRN